MGRRVLRGDLSEVHSGRAAKAVTSPQSNYRPALPSPRFCAGDQFIARPLQSHSLSCFVTWNLDSVNISLFPVSLMSGFVSREFCRDTARPWQKGLPSRVHVPISGGACFPGDWRAGRPGRSAGLTPARQAGPRTSPGPFTPAGAGSLRQASLPPAGCGFLWSCAPSEEVRISLWGGEEAPLSS